MATPRRPIRILNVLGAPADCRDAMAKAAVSYEPIDAMVGDWMSELDMPPRAYKIQSGTQSGYEPSFLEALELAIENIAKKGIKLAASAGTVAVGTTGP